MDNEKRPDAAEAALLKECYDLAARFEKIDNARDIIREKLKKVSLYTDGTPMTTAAVVSGSGMDVISEIMYKMSLEGTGGSGKNDNGYAYKLERLPYSGEKEFLLALLALRDGTDETHRKSALLHIYEALKESNEDPRYVALAAALQNA